MQHWTGDVRSDTHTHHKHAHTRAHTHALTHVHTHTNRVCVFMCLLVPRTGPSRPGHGPGSQVSTPRPRCATTTSSNDKQRPQHPYSNTSKHPRTTPALSPG